MADITEKDREFLKTYNADKYEHPSVTVDMLIFTSDIKGQLELLLIKRKNPPYQDCWALPGGFVNMDESIEDAAKRELFEETSIKGIHMEQLYTFGSVDRDPRTRVISVAYIAMVSKGRLQAVAGDDAAETAWFGVSKENEKIVFTIGNGMINAIVYPEIAFDHEKIIKTAIDRMQGKVSYTPIAFEFLKDKQRFSIYELKKVYDAILGQKQDTSNFRNMFLKKYVKNGIVKETGEECREFCHRPSKYYKYTG